MTKPIPWQNRIYLNFAALADRGGVYKHLTYLCSGWLSLFQVAPRMAANPPNGLTMVLGMALLLATLWVSAPVINAMKPVFQAAGQLTDTQISFLMLVAVNLWRYAAGRKLMQAFQATLPTTPSPSQQGDK